MSVIRLSRRYSSVVLGTTKTVARARGAVQWRTIVKVAAVAPILIRTKRLNARHYGPVALPTVSVVVILNVFSMTVVGWVASRFFTVSLLLSRKRGAALGILKLAQKARIAISIRRAA